MGVSRCLYMMKRGVNCRSQVWRACLQSLLLWCQVTAANKHWHGVHGVVRSCWGPRWLSQHAPRDQAWSGGYLWLRQRWIPKHSDFQDPVHAWRGRFLYYQWMSRQGCSSDGRLHALWSASNSIIDQFIIVFIFYQLSRGYDTHGYWQNININLKLIGMK